MNTAQHWTNPQRNLGLDDFQMATTNKACGCFLVPEEKRHLHSDAQKRSLGLVRSRATPLKGMTRALSGLMSKIPH
jgi:hypothetical protein